MINLSLCVENKSRLSLEEKILNGISPYDHELYTNFPNLLALASLRDSNDVHFCTAIGISDYQFLTAADCIIPYETEPDNGKIFVRIGFGVYYVKSLKTPRKNKKKDFFYNDLGLVTVSHLNNPKLCHRTKHIHILLFYLTYTQKKDLIKSKKIFQTNNFL